MLIKNTLPAGWAAGALALSCISLFHTFGTETALAAPNFLAPGYGGTVYHQDSGADPIISFDWGNDGALYYSTAASGFMFGGVYRAESGSTTTVAAADSNFFSAASVVSIGDFVYYNNSDFSNNQFIYGYGPLGATPSVSQLSSTANSGLYTSNGRLFITGAPGFGTNEIYFSELDAGGGLINDPAISLGVTSGGSGPLAFDAAGNLYYAPGFSDTSIYKWSAAELAAAMVDPEGAALSVSGHLWAEYGDIFETVSGATSMIIGADGGLWLTLSDFENPSVLASFSIDGLGDYAGQVTTILENSGRLGELRELDGAYYVSADNAIYLITVPEPGAGALIILAIAGSFLVRGRRGRSA